MKTMEWVRHSLELVWRHKYLWFFGFFVGGVGGGGGGNGAVATSPGGSSGVGERPAWLWPALGTVLVLTAMVVVLHVLSEAALIEGVRQGRGGERLGVRRGLSFARPFFWRIAGIKFLLSIAVMAIAAGVAAPALLGILEVMPLASGIIGTLLLALIGIPVLLTAYFVHQYALRFVVLEGQRMGDAIRAAYRFLHGRLAEALRLLLAAILAQLGGGFAAALLLVPGALVGAAIYFAAGLVPAIAVAAALGLPLAFAAIGASGAFISSIWTLAFLDQREQVA